MMRKAVSAAAMTLLASSIAYADPLADYISSAMTAPIRQADRTNDTRRHGAEIAALAEIKPGEHVADFLPGGGYWTRIFSGIVGPEGRVLDIWPAGMVAPGSKGETRMKALAGAPGVENVAAVPDDLAHLTLPTPIDVFFTSQNLHDLPTPFLGNIDITAFSKQVFDLLKPGGRFVVVDHVAAPGRGLSETNTLHRIDPELAKKAILRAGFTLKSESKLLSNPEDDHHLKVFDPTIRGKTDQFIFVFIRPTL
ncbi:class I SAM-dependent methyltransferase [Gluconobacter sphaericus]|uniref:class I SAM-dependent methyltransferase n=1 Tax=Gluconobacter sphaericus TaxID=574987 RepID=UPI00192354EC|nr:class I SAM-dependent methyltransferase [Gluconobacter sphaericus]QQX90191.1 class I SAM-dependent methyltransferase [Gluconobacter sphaericus]